MANRDRTPAQPAASCMRFGRAHDARTPSKKIDLRDAAGERMHRRPPVARAPGHHRAACCAARSARDLEALLNTIALRSTVDLTDASKRVARSILNFGLPDIVHRSIDEVRRRRNPRRRSGPRSSNFEPRLASDTLRVAARQERRQGRAQGALRRPRRADVRSGQCSGRVRRRRRVDSGKIVINRL